MWSQIRMGISTSRMARDRKHALLLPVEFIPNVELTGRGGQPKNIVMLTCDAFGVLPPIAKLTPAQAMYHFLSGYTAQVAGTEKGLGKEPKAVFSTCFAPPVSAAASRGVRSYAGRPDGSSQRDVLAGQHRLERRAPSAPGVA